jgi:YidC/Oxa1 family membrane protein insertase
MWRGGFGDQTVENPASVQKTVYYDLVEGELTANEVKIAKDGPVSSTGSYSFAGLQDQYFAAVFLPIGATSLQLQTFSDNAHSIGASQEQAHVGAGVGGTGLNRFSLFVGPKDMDLMKRIDPKLANLVDWGWFWFLAEPLFYALNWVNDNLTRNYGWAIVLVTVAINFLTLPLRITSLRSAKKMQALQPHIAAINARYKDVGLRDPRKQEQNAEVMNLYKKHGVNPAGGCVPMLAQIPFFIAFYNVLNTAVELRGAPWLWVSDLSLPENLPIRILPVTMIVTQFVLQKMTPAPSADPAQQRIMLLMPLMFGFMFYGVSSGLVLYWLTGNVIGIAQQWFFNKTHKDYGVAIPAPVVPGKKAKK